MRKRPTLEINTKIGRLTVTSAETKPEGSEYYYVDCLCECGKKKTIRSDRLISGNTRSCGCLRGTSGNSGRPLYHRWIEIRNRCHNPKSKDYRNYGLRGVTVCDEWFNDYPAFEKWAFENGFEPGLELDRRDNDGPYSPVNCQWLSRYDNLIKAHKHRGHNHRDHSVDRLLTAFGETRTLSDWLTDPRCSVSSVVTIAQRIERGWGGEEAITTASKKIPAQLITIGGVTKSMRAWAKDPRCTVAFSSLQKRLRNGMEPEKAVFMPPPSPPPLSLRRENLDTNQMEDVDATTTMMVAKARELTPTDQLTGVITAIYFERLGLTDKLLRRIYGTVEESANTCGWLAIVGVTVRYMRLDADPMDLIRGIFSNGDVACATAEFVLGKGLVPRIHSGGIDFKTVT